jgi:hypothetical protein
MASAVEYVLDVRHWLTTRIPAAGAMPTQPTLLSTARISPSTAVPWPK